MNVQSTANEEIVRIAQAEMVTKLEHARAFKEEDAAQYSSRAAHLQRGTFT
ncbi:hypothetical protein IVB02_29635 [Bradyrhizobium sp. 166]|uniref:hypothetical protein n=1 Tax=Bradyrhizobium sp. 166 TaxID=2782638 RepID=UPI001FF9712E|nr:hypothetical protein [Bradyrhizobium sp. 166]MCK1605448.1 hypothetical protein [Bradyrhizobium sp. 166]